MNINNILTNFWSSIKSYLGTNYQPKGSYANSSHTHDDRYYTESEINTKLNTKANDTNVVHKSGDETIDGFKTFTGTRLDENNEPFNYSNLTLRDPRFTKGDIPSKTEYIGHIVMLANNQENPTTTSERLGGIVVSVDSKGDTHVAYQCLQNKANDTGRWLRIEQVNPYNTEEDPYTLCSSDFIPRDNNSYGLGTSTNKWKTINGINPGALSLPNTSSGINLDLTNFKLDGSNNLFKITDFTNYPYDNGWLFVKLHGCTSYFADHWYKVVANTFATPSTVSFFIPINDSIHNIALQCVCTNIEYVKIFPCQGNV